jgi:hypothetical protein
MQATRSTLVCCGALPAGGGGGGIGGISKPPLESKAAIVSI